MAEQVFLAADLGASSGRVVAGLFDGARLRLEETHRFANGPVVVAGDWHWDVLRLWTQLQEGLRSGAQRYGDNIRSLGVDTWGVDYALLDGAGKLLGNPYHYRDHRTDGILEQAFETVSREEIFAQTGLQFMQFNTLYQLLAMRRQNPATLDVARRLLMMPDVFHWLLTGQQTNELTNATTTQFYNPLRQAWATELLEKFDLPAHVLGEISQPGANLGPLTRQSQSETGLSAAVDVILPGTHDTASAVMAAPAQSRPGERPDWCYISSGTWSLMGVESPRPVVNDVCRNLNFTNEGGVGGTTRLLKNITGLWLLQECRRIWNAAGRDHSWGELNRLSDAAAPLVSFIDPDAAAFVAPDDMPAAVRQACAATGQTVPQDPGAVIRCALESLALKSRQVFGWLEQLVGGRIETIHIVGGGVQNVRLCQATADACGRRVVAGPIEATAIGNIMTQAISAGAVSSIAEAREIVRRSFDVETYEPRQQDAWNEAFARFERLSPPPA